MSLVVFPLVKLKRTFQWKEDGKRRRKTGVFEQTVNPFNRNVDGSMKTREQIVRELGQQADRWIAECKRKGKGVDVRTVR